MPDLTVVIPVRNGAMTISHQLEALADAVGSAEVEVIVADNGSTDDTAAVVARESPAVLSARVVDASQVLGVSHARNVGVRAAGSDRIAICDADDVVGPTWVEAMLTALERHPVVTGPLLVRDINPQAIAGSRGTRAEREAPTFFGAFPYAHGCNQGFHRDAWARVGGFDESMTGIPAEDLDFGLRLHLAGIPIHFAPDAAVSYRYRTEVRALWQQGLGYGFGRTFIARRARDAGLRVPRAPGWRSWVWLGCNAWRWVHPEARGGLAWVAGNRVGHVVGSARNRVVLL